MMATSASTPLSSLSPGQFRMNADISYRSVLG